MDLNDKINDWKRQIEQAEEYGMFFDVDTVKDIVTTLEQLKEDFIHTLNVMDTAPNYMRMKDLIKAMIEKLR